MLSYDNATPDASPITNHASRPTSLTVKADRLPQPNSQDQAADLVGRLFEQYYQDLWAYLYRLVDDREWAADLVQEAYLRLFEARGRLQGVQNRRAWVYRIATNVAFDALKRRRRFTWLPWSKLSPAQRSQADGAEAVLEQTAIAAALGQLSPRDRAPLLLYSYYGFSTAEVAEALGLSQSAVKTRLYRARERFRKVYQGGHDYDRT